MMHKRIGAAALAIAVLVLGCGTKPPQHDYPSHPKRTTNNPDHKVGKGGLPG